MPYTENEEWTTWRARCSVEHQPGARVKVLPRYEMGPSIGLGHRVPDGWTGRTMVVLAKCTATNDYKLADTMVDVHDWEVIIHAGRLEAVS